MELQKFSFAIVITLFALWTISQAAVHNLTTAARYEPPQSRIYGGNDAVEGQFPYHVLVTRAGNGYIVVCGGAIISRNYVVTAAHCVNGYSPSDYSIRAGTTKFNSGGVVVPVAEVKIHPQFKPSDFDIALVRLSKSLEFNDKIKPILLASTEVPEDSQVIITGWGTIESGGLADRLQYNTVEALNYDTCVKRLNVLSNSRRCFAKSAGNGICAGDSGGPAVYNGVLIGVAVFSVNGCGSSLPDGFTDILVSRDWIRANTDVDCTCSV